MRAGQASMEFVLLMGFLIVTFLTFTAVTQYRISQAEDAHATAIMRQAGNILVSEIELATSSHKGYARTFTMPRTLDGRRYNVTIIDEEAVIQSSGEEYVLFLNASVDGRLCMGENTIEQISHDHVKITQASAPPAYAQDFEGYVAGDEPYGWVDTEQGNSMQVDDSLFSVAQVGSTMALSTGSFDTNIHSHYRPDDSLMAWSDYNLSGRMRITNNAAGIGVTIHSNYNDADAYYRLRRMGGTPADQAFHLKLHPDSSSNNCDGTGVTTDVNPSPNTWYRFRFHVSEGGTRLRVKVWQEGTAEPAWTASTGVIDCTINPSQTTYTDGTFGVWAMNSGEKYWDDFEVQAKWVQPCWE